MSEQDNNNTSVGKSISGKTILYVGGALGIIALMNRAGAGFWGSKELSDKDYEMLKSAQQNGTIGDLLANDTSPVAFKITNNTLTYEQRLSLISDLGTKYQSITDKIAENLQTTASDIYGRIGLTLSGSLPDGATMSERGLELYFKMLDIWSKNHAGIAFGVASEVTKLWLGAAATDVTSCTSTTFVKDVTETSEAEQARSQSVVIKTTARNGFLGIVGRKKTTVETQLSSSMEKRTDTRKIVYVPHCTSVEVDPLKLEVLYNTTLMGVKLQMAQLIQSFNSCPDPLNFVKV